MHHASRITHPLATKMRYSIYKTVARVLVLRFLGSIMARLSLSSKLVLPSVKCKEHIYPRLQLDGRVMTSLAE
jgi:hypothetical protein